MGVPRGLEVVVSRLNVTPFPPSLSDIARRSAADQVATVRGFYEEAAAEGTFLDT